MTKKFTSSSFNDLYSSGSLAVCSSTVWLNVVSKSLYSSLRSLFENLEKWMKMINYHQAKWNTPSSPQNFNLGNKCSSDLIIFNCDWKSALVT